LNFVYKYVIMLLIWYIPQQKERAMKQQQGAYPIQRASRVQPVAQSSRSQPPSRSRHPARQLPANPHYAYAAGIHPEDQPNYYSDDLIGDLEDDDSYYLTRPPNSVRRYEQPQPQVMQRGKRRIVIHPEPPPRKWHWSVYVGSALFIMVMGYLLVAMLGVWWQGKQDDWTYGNPRTYQTDINVGHGSGASHFIAVNLDGTIQVIEIPGNDASKAHIYSITTLPAGSGAVPVTLSFKDINGDGKLDMLVTIGESNSQQYTVFLFNNGTTFVSKL
jgi:hypothetical protein